MDSQKRKNERADSDFNRRELGPLLRLFSSLGITLTLGIVCFFLLGSYFNRRLGDVGLQTYGLPGIAITLCGITLSLYWCYMRICKHIAKYAPKDDGQDQEGSRNS